jgi:hypothetical protein
MSNSPLSLRTVLFFDAATCAVMGTALMLGAGPIASLTLIPPSLLYYAGLMLLPIAAFMALVALPANPPALGVWLVILGNIGWVIASVALIFGDWIAPNTLGILFIGAQAAAVALLAALEYGGLTSARRLAV